MKNIKQSLFTLLFALLILFSTACDPASTESAFHTAESLPASSAVTAEANTPPKPSASSERESSSEKKTVSSEHSEKATASPTKWPVFSGKPYVPIHDNIPQFSAAERTEKGYEKYGKLDALGRCTAAVACCGVETMPRSGEKRSSIGSVQPTGWVQAKYDRISGKYLYNRCHLIGWQLSAENDNPKNLITGTKYLNISGMLPFENMVADYIKETHNHVAYRISPIFEKNHLLASGVQMEAYSIEDHGESICFNVYCFNVQPGITIDYATGKSRDPSAKSSSKVTEKTASKKTVSTLTKKTAQPQNSATVYRTPTGKRYHLIASCGGKNSYAVPKKEAEKDGLTPCKKCAR